MKLSISIFCTIAFLTYGCDKLIKKKGDNSDEPIPEPDLSTTGAFLTMADFPKTDLKQISNEDALNILKDSSDIYFTSPENAGNSDKSPIVSCIAKLPTKLKTINKNTVAIEIEADLLGCLQTSSNSETDDYSTFTKFNIKAVDNLYCSFVDFTELNEKEPAAVEDSVSARIDQECQDAKTSSIFGNITFEAQVESEGMVAKIISRNATMSSEGKACVTTKTDSGRIFGDCIFAEYTKQETQDGDAITIENELFQLEASELTVGTNPEEKWYSGGKFNVTANNITGFLNYSSPASAPTYSLTNGTNEITGTLNPETASFQLNSENLTKSFFANRIRNLLKNAKF